MASFLNYSVPSAGKNFARKKNTTGRKIAGSRLPTLTFLSNIRLKPMAKISTEPIQDSWLISASVSHRADESREQRDTALIHQQRQHGQVHALAERGREHDGGHAVEHGFCDQDGWIAV